MNPTLQEILKDHRNHIMDELERTLAKKPTQAEIGLRTPEQNYEELDKPTLQAISAAMDSILTNAVVDENFTKEVDEYIKKVRANLNTFLGGGNG